MPYINSLDRDGLTPFGMRPAATAGELSFQLTKVIVRYLMANGVSYQRLNDCVGALEGAKLELYRRVIADYEDGKCLANGDVYQAILDTRESQ